MCNAGQKCHKVATKKKGGKLCLNNYIEKMKGPRGSGAKQEPMQSFHLKASDLFFLPDTVCPGPKGQADFDLKNQALN